jgi:hypothetical protein
MKRKSSQFLKESRPSAQKKCSVSGRNRLAQKKAFANIWLKEATWHRYRYYVETCNDGSRVYLTRPTQLNKGVDFQVKLEGFRSYKRKRKSERPSHDDVVHDLVKKLKQRPSLKKDLFQAICRVYDCEEPIEAIRRHRKVKRMTAGLPIDKILRIVKWLFIEQDVTYWLGTGRNMFMCSLENRVFKMKHKLYG